MSGYFVNGVNLDDIFEPRNGRTPTTPTGYKVNGTDLNQRYLGINHVESLGAAAPTGFSEGGYGLHTTFSKKAAFVQHTLLPSDPSNGMNFGITIQCSGDGNYLIVGTATPAVYIFVKSGGSWTQQTKITTSLPAAARVSISYDGSRCAIAGNASSFVTYTRSGSSWTLEATVSNGSATSSISMSPILADRIVIGTTTFGGQGHVRVYVRSGSTWSFQQQITGANARTLFGTSVSITDWYLVVGDPTSGGVEANANGEAIVYLRSGSVWSPMSATFRPQPGTTTGFSTVGLYGTSVNINSEGDRLIIGHPSAAVSGVSVFGGYYRYSRSGSTWTQTNYNVGGTTSYHLSGLGRAVATDNTGNNFIIGAPRYVYNPSTTTFSDSGFALYKVPGDSVTRMRLNPLTDGARFGQSVSCSNNGNTWAMSAPGGVVGGTSSGCVFLYSI